jgi:mycobactin lysine-N-oxygenase
VNSVTDGELTVIVETRWRKSSFSIDAAFSDPTGWTSLTYAERRDALLADDRIWHLRGPVAHAVAWDDRIRLTPSSNQAGEAGAELFDDATGFDGQQSVR